MVGFRDFDGVGKAPVSNKLAVKCDCTVQWTVVDLSTYVLNKFSAVNKNSNELIGKRNYSCSQNCIFTEFLSYFAAQTIKVKKIFAEIRPFLLMIPSLK